MANGQLWYGNTKGDGGNDERIVRVNNDGTGQTTVVDNKDENNNNSASFPALNPADIGLDTARGYYFAIFNNGDLAQGASLVRGSLTGGGSTTLINYAATGTTGPSGQNTTANSIVSALVVDPFSQRILVGVQDPNGTDGSKSGIRSYSYDNAGNLTDNGFIITQTSSGKGLELNFKLLDVNDFTFDRASGNLYFTETGSGNAKYTGLFRVNVDTPGAAVQVVDQNQFPDSGVNGYMRDVEVDAARNHVFFSTYSQRPSDGTGTNSGYDPNDNGIWVISTTGGANQTAARVVLTGAPGNFYPEDMTFDATTNQLYVETSNNEGNSDDAILVFQLAANGLTGTLLRTITPATFNSNLAGIAGMTFNDLPDVVAAGGNFTEGNGPAAVSPAATVTDGDGLERGATVQLTTNFNSATDTLSYTNPNGITGSYNSGTGLLTLSGVASAAAYQTAIRSITFTASGDNPTNFGAATSRGYTVTIDDGSPAVPTSSSNTTSGTFTVTGINDAPVIGNINTTNDSVAYTQNAAAVKIDAGGNGTVSDVDSGNFAGGTLTVAATQGGAAQTGDKLNIDTSGPITVSGGTVSDGGTAFAVVAGPDTSTLTFTLSANATPARVQDLLHALTFATSSTVGGTRTIAYALNDGDGTDNGGMPTGPASSSVVVTIPLPAISINDVTHNEGNTGTTSYEFTVSLSQTSTDTVTVDYMTTDGSATTADGDYAATTGTVTFAPGETSQTVTVLVDGDAKFENNETFNVTLSNPTKATIDDGQGVGAITNEDAQPVASIGNVTQAEGNSGTTVFEFTITLSAASGLTTTVNYATAGGTAMAGQDYTATSGSVTFAPGETSKTVTVDVTGDTVFEANQTFGLNITSATNATAGGNGTGTITNDDVAPTLAISDVTVSEAAGTATVTVTRTGATELDSSANYATADGTAVSVAGGPGTPDYTAASGTVTIGASLAATATQTFTVSLTNDAVHEASEQFVVDLTTPTNATNADAQGVVTITNDDPAPTLSIGNTTVNEGAGTASFTVTLTGATALPIAVNFATLDNTAVSTTSAAPGTPDYVTMSGTLTFDASANGTQTRTITVPIVNDATNEGSEQFAVTLSGATNGATISNAQGNATITDNDAVPSIAINDVSVVEGNSGTTALAFTVTLGAESGQTVTVGYTTADGTATAGQDYVARNGTLTFAPGETSKTVTVLVNGDTVFEPDQTVLLNLSIPTNVTIADAQGVGTITNDDAPPTLAISDVTVSEAAGTATVTVTLTGMIDQPVSVAYATANGSAVSAATATPGTPDYSATNGTLTFQPGTQTLAVMVPITNDTVFENTEQFVANLSNATGGAVISDNQGAITITNDDPPPAPSQPDLVAALDSGVSNSDNLTNVTRPTFTGTAAPGVTVTLYEGATARGSGIAAADGTWTITVASALADRSHAISAQASSGNLVGPASTALTIVVDTIAPAAPGVALARDTGISSTDALTNDASLAVGATDSGGFGYKVDNGAYSSSYDPTALADGPHTVSVFQFDAAGNASADSSVSFVLDRTAPTARPDTASGIGVVAKLTGNLLANDSDASAIRATDVQFAQSLVKTLPGTGTAEAFAAHGTLTVAADGSYSYQPRSSGRDSFSYTVIDAAGNASQSTLTVDVAKAAIPASLSLAFALTDATFDFSTGHDLVTAPNGTVIDLTGIGSITFTDGTVQEADGSPLVDDLFYAANNLDVWRAKVDPDAHYAGFGWREGRDPNEQFSTRDYLGKNPDVAAASTNPLDHYAAFGVHEGRSPGAGFSAEAYRAANPDVARAGVDPLTHYLGFGQAEDRFAFPGATVAQGSGDHLYGDFDATFYLKTNADVAKAAAASGIDADSFAFTHYLTFGAAEGRDPDAYFSTKGYLAANPDVAASGANPLLHYAAQGWFEGRDPSATFHTNAYLIANPDVAAAHVDPLQHYLQFGIAEGRLIG